LYCQHILKQGSAETVALGQYDWSLCAKFSLLFGFFKNAIRGQGTERHYYLLDMLANGQVNAYSNIRIF
jgi:hypothetical protein